MNHKEHGSQVGLTASLKVLEKAWGVSLNSHDQYTELGTSPPALVHKRDPRAGERAVPWLAKQGALT